MTFAKQFQLISDKGDYIGVRPYYGYFINLYLLENTFYEVWYFRLTNEIEKIEILDNQDKLNLYIDFQLKLNQIKNND